MQIKINSDGTLSVAEKDFVPGHGGLDGGGLFSNLSLNWGVTSALPLPQTGLLDVLPVRPNGSITNNPEYGIVTGVTGETVGTPAATSCDPPQRSTGLLKLCTQRSPFGCFSIEAQQYDIKKMGMLQTNEMAPIQMVGNPFDRSGGQFVPAQLSGSSQNLSDPTIKLMMELLTGVIRYMTPYFWTGTGVDIDARDREVYGFEQLINTGYVDVSGPACPRADSYVLDWAVDGPGGDICDNSNAFYQLVLNAYITLKDRAKKFGLNPASWAIAMPEGLFRNATYVWPCEMATFKCGGNLAPNSAVNINVDNQNLQQQMREGKYLWIDGQQVPVIIDDTIPIDDAAAPDLVSSMYFIPFAIRGSQSPVFRDYFNFNSPYRMENGAMRDFFMSKEGSEYQIFGNGQWLLLKNPMNHGCRTVELVTAPRPVLLTPQIAARIDNLQYRNQYQNTEWNPAAAGFVNGGLTVQP